MADYIDYRSTQEVTAPVSLKGVADLLNSSGSGDPAWYDVGSVCTSDRVNIWAKYKPWNAGLTGYLFTDLDCNRQITQNYGLKVSGSIPMYYWEWDKPTGGETSPYRLGDFRKYKHDAVAPCSIKVTNILFQTSSLDNSAIANVACIKGFTVKTGSTDDKTEFVASANTVGEYEYSADFFSLYGSRLLCIKDDNGYYRYWNMKPNEVGGYYVSFVLPLTPDQTTQDYDAVMLLSTGSVTYDDDNEGTTTNNNNIYPLLSKNNKFTLRLTQHTIWDDSVTNWGSGLQLYVNTVQLNQSIATGSGGTNETWNLYYIGGLKTTCEITFSKTYARSVYLYMALTIGYSGSTVDYPVRMVTPEHRKISGSTSTRSVAECLVLGQGYYTPGCNIEQGISNAYFDKSEGLTFKLSDVQPDGIFPFGSTIDDTTSLICICVKTEYVSQNWIALGTTLHAYSSSGSKEDDYDCGSNDIAVRNVSPEGWTKSRTWYPE